MIYDILEARLIAAGLVAGQTLFRQTMPAEVPEGAMLRAPLDGVAIDPYMRGHFNDRIQLITRHRDPVEGLALSNQLDKALRFEGQETHPATSERPATVFKLCYPLTLPIQYPRLDGGGFEASQRFRISWSYLSS